MKKASQFQPIEEVEEIMPWDLHIIFQKSFSECIQELEKKTKTKNIWIGASIV